MTDLTKRQFLGAVGSTAVIAALPKSVFAAPLSYDLAPVQVADGIWMIEGRTEYFSAENGGAIVNCALIETEAGIVLVDTGPSRKYGEALLDVARGLNGRGVAGVMITHHHPDHFFGNQVFSDKPIHALPETRALAESQGDGFADNMYRLLGDWMRGTEPAPPNTDVSSSVISIGGRSFETLPLSGHTGADLAILDQKTGLLIAGDLAFLNRAPTTPHADLPTWRAALDVLTEKNASAILPGHGPLDTSGASLAQTRDYLDWLEATLKQAALDGLDMVEIMDEPLPDRFAGMGAMPQEFHRSIAHLYPQIERDSMPLGQ
ncbi:quinoprotein relay system zinc metallohydrolase 1 [Roseibium sediminis]|uniref:quinoprotein relay system zinc metallohydrolase 1 n=1 Tax=Roseibium sediminis TaxID=1775174 RepID=UPI00123DC878|nr:quinoprotein relay system zinc metallohydrolase 1 [Roseibium sediminis]